MTRFALVGLLALVPAVHAQDRPASYYTVQGLYVATSALDLASTLWLYPTCRPTCREENPLMRGALERGPLPAIGLAVSIVGINVLVAELMYRDERLGRKVWWMLPVANTVLNLLVIRSNLREWRAR